MSAESVSSLTSEQRAAIERAGDHPVRIEDPETGVAYLIVREDVYHRLCTLAAIDHSDRSLFEVGTFHPDR